MTQAHNNIMALDVGDSRIGIATASSIALLPAPLGIISNNTETVDKLKKLVDEQNIGQIVVGLPRDINGNETSQTHLTRKFASKIELELNIPVHLQDEALTSVKAEEELKARNIAYNKEDVDALAATYILSDYLDQRVEKAK